MHAADVTFSAGRKMILNGVSAVLEEVSFTAVVGANGAGKSTLLRVLAGVSAPQSGHVTIAPGRSVFSLTHREKAQCVAWVPATSDTPFAFTVLDSVVFGRFAWHGGTPTASDYEAARAALGRVGIEDLAARSITTLSSGEREKTQIARALASGAKYFFLDEPSANLDIGASLKIFGLLQRLSCEGKIICASFHDLNLARRFATHAIMLVNGKVAASGEAKTTLVPETIDRVFGVATRLVSTPETGDLLTFL